MHIYILHIFLEFIGISLYIYMYIHIRSYDISIDVIGFFAFHNYLLIPFNSGPARCRCGTPVLLGHAWCWGIGLRFTLVARWREETTLLGRVQSTGSNTMLSLDSSSGHTHLVQLCRQTWKRRGWDSCTMRIGCLWSRTSFFWSGGTSDEKGCKSPEWSHTDPEISHNTRREAGEG